MYAPSLLSITIFLPLLGVFCIFWMNDKNEAARNNVRAVALLTSFAVFIMSCIGFAVFDPSQSEFQLEESYQWLEGFNSTYHVGVDGISILFVLLTAFLTPLAILSTWHSIQVRVKEYMIAFLALETTMLGAFCALDFILFYLFFEAVLIPMYLIIGIWGGERRIYASIKFFLYTLLGSVLMLVAILTLYHYTGTSEISMVARHTLPFDLQKWLWLAFFASFAVKIPMWPVHTWLPDAHVEAPTSGSVILAAILLKMGGYGFLRFSLPLFPEASQFFAPLIFILSMVAVVYASLVALVQKDMKKLIAYSSIAHMGFVTFGIFTFSTQGIQGALFQMISHGLVSGALFLCVGVLYDRLHTRDIDQYGGVVHPMPHYAVLFMIFILGAIGLPGTSGFVGEILILVAAFKVSGWMACVLGLGVILSAVYALWLYGRIMFGKVGKPAVGKLQDLTIIEKLTLGPLAFLVLLFGIYPAPILRTSEITVEKWAGLLETGESNRGDL
ncbi:NADH-quinone oxidoreductase subunit M [Caedimonas varicaedens]|uniref:NADH-quinone oxidoreductase subunit M n=1 Tax=Caedimonas varicaedens TaxID=1629334 RepID=A0A0K8MEC7_9PROT|nr:NADH-quinone oxidoreductase subunit M [Caedimonas varicaedens]